jgi:GT2 family glycosyltransferase
MQKVSVVIPVYNGWDHVKQNVNALLTYDRTYLEEIIVVDDCSTTSNPYRFDDTVVKIIRNPENFQFTKSVNRGLKCAVSDIIICLDADSYPVGPFLEQVIAKFTSDPSVGCIGFKTIDENGKETGSHMYEPSAMEFIIGQHLQQKFDKSRKNRKQNILVFACSMSFRKQCLEEINYFDEDTFPNFDCDLDISMRVHRSKWKLVHTNDIEICHTGGSSYKINYKRVILSHKSRWRLLQKHRLIQSPGVVKFFLKCRIRAEILVLKFLAGRKNLGTDYSEKEYGRKILLKEVDSF